MGNGPPPELTRLEEQIGRLLRLGVFVSAGLLILGLVQSYVGAGAAVTTLRAGLVVLMAIPVTRIVASFVDAVRRRDGLLSSSTAVVLSVMALTLVYSFRYADVDAADEVTHTFSINPAPAPNGKQIVYVAPADGREQLFVIVSGSAPPVRLLSDSANDDDPAWSPDGAHIAFVSDVTGMREVFVINANGSALVQVTHEPAAAIHPSWAPDSQRLAYCVQTNEIGTPDRFELMEIRWDGSGRRAITHDDADDTFPSWSPDGTRLAFRKTIGSNSEIFVVNADGTGERDLTNDAAFDGWPAWSPDGHHIAFASDRRSHNQIFVMDTDGRHPTLVANTLGRATAPRWSPDSREIYFTNCTTSETNPDCRILRASMVAR